MSTCPALAELQRYSLGNVASDELQTVETHLETCQVCQAVLAGLRHEPDPLLVALRAPAGVEPPTNSEYLRGLAAARQIGPRQTVTSAPPPPQLDLTPQTAQPVLKARPVASSTTLAVIWSLVWVGTVFLGAAVGLGIATLTKSSEPNGTVHLHGASHLNTTATQFLVRASDGTVYVLHEGPQHLPPGAYEIRAVGTPLKTAPRTFTLGDHQEVHVQIYGLNETVPQLAN